MARGDERRTVGWSVGGKGGHNYGQLGPIADHVNYLLENFDSRARNIFLPSTVQLTGKCSLFGKGDWSSVEGGAAHSKHNELLGGGDKDDRQPPSGHLYCGFLLFYN